MIDNPNSTPPTAEEANKIALKQIDGRLTGLRQLENQIDEIPVNSTLLKPEEQQNFQEIGKDIAVSKGALEKEREIRGQLDENISKLANSAATRAIQDRLSQQRITSYPKSYIKGAKVGDPTVPCPTPVRLGPIRVTPPMLANKGNVLAVAERLDGGVFEPDLDRVIFGGLGSIFIVDGDQMWVSKNGLLFFIPPAQIQGHFSELSVPSLRQVFPTETTVQYTADSLLSVRSIVRQMAVLRDASKLRTNEGSQTPGGKRLRYDLILEEGHRRLEKALDAIDESSEPASNQEAIVEELKAMGRSHGPAVDAFTAATFPPQKTELA